MVCNITAPLRLHPYISNWTRLNSRHFVCVLCTSCSMGITLTNYERKFCFSSPETNDIMQHFSRTNHLLHTVHVVYQLHSKPYSLTPPSTFIFFPKNAAFSTNQSKPVFPKNAPIKKIDDRKFKPNRIYFSRLIISVNNFFSRPFEKSIKKLSISPQLNTLEDWGYRLAEKLTMTTLILTR